VQRIPADEKPGLRWGFQLVGALLHDQSSKSTASGTDKLIVVVMTSSMTRRTSSFSAEGASTHMESCMQATIRPSKPKQVPYAGFLSGESPLELKQAQRLLFHRTSTSP